MGLSLRQALAGSGWWVSSTLTVLLNVMTSDHLAKATQEFLEENTRIKECWIMFSTVNGNSLGLQKPGWSPGASGTSALPPVSGV